MKRQSGFSLIELMLAMLIGLIIIGGVMSLYISTRDTQRASEQQLRMVADARFVIQSLGHDIMHAGSWGGTTLNTLIECRAGDASCPGGDVLPLATADCANSNYINLDQPVVGYNDTNPFGSTCATNGYRANTDILQLRFADSSVIDTASLAADSTYIRSNASGGKMFVGDVLPASNTPFWENDLVSANYPMRSNTYYVSDYTDAPGDGMPSLRKASLIAGPEVDDDVLLAGVEDLQVQYGIVDPVNTNPGDSTSVVSYVDADSIANNVGWQNVKAIKIWVLMRSERKDREDIGGSQTFTIAGKAPQTFSDGYRRLLVSSVVKLRNTGRLDESLQAGTNN